MDLIVVLISIDVIASKFLDSYITSNRLAVIERERKSWFSRQLEKMGIENDVWLSFLFTVLLVGTGVYLLNTFYTATPYQLLFVFTGLFATTLNLGAAHSSYFGKNNFITEKLLQQRKVRV